MRVHRFYITEIIGTQKEITVQSNELVNQLARVFRLKSGDAVILFDGSGNDYECAIQQYDQKTVTFNIAKRIPSRFVPDRRVSLYAAVVKKDTFEWIAEKATELGVTEIVPVMAERSEKKQLNEERLKKIVQEASEQSGRGTVPVLGAIVPLEEALKSVSTKHISAVAFHTDGEALTASTTVQIQGTIAIFIGPEGGWSPKEIEMFHGYAIPVLSMGHQILRAETAVVAALSLTMLGNGC